MALIVLAVVKPTFVFCLKKDICLTRRPCQSSFKSGSPVIHPFKSILYLDPSYGANRSSSAIEV